MDCERTREALSARLDDEEPGLSAAAIDQHLDTCVACAAWAVDVGALHRLTRVRAAEPVPDLSAAIVAAAWPGGSRPTAPRQPVSAARWGLVVVALTQLVLAVPAVLLGDDPGATVHVAREMGSFEVALAVGLLVAAWQPARAWGLLPVAAALGLVLAGTAVLDVIDGTTGVAGESPHLLDLAGIALLWAVARHDRSTAPALQGRSPRWSPA